MQSAVSSKRLWEYYVFDVQDSVKDVAGVLEGGSIKVWSGESLAGKPVDALARIVSSSSIIRNYRRWNGRNCTSVEPDVAAGFIKAAYPDDHDTSSLASKWGKTLDVLNVDLYSEYNEDIKTAIDGVVGRLRYTRVDEHGPKMGEINKKLMIIHGA